MSENTTPGDGNRRAHVESLLDSYDSWRGAQAMDTDDYGLMAKTVALYRIAIANQDRQGAALLTEALAVFEAAEREER